MKQGVLVLTGGHDLVMLKMGPLELEVARLFFRLACDHEWWWLVPAEHARAWVEAQRKSPLTFRCGLSPKLGGLEGNLAR